MASTGFKIDCEENEMDIVELLKKEGYIVVEGAKETKRLIEHVAKEKK